MINFITYWLEKGRHQAASLTSDGEEEMSASLSIALPRSSSVPTPPRSAPSRSRLIKFGLQWATGVSWATTMSLSLHRSMSLAYLGCPTPSQMSIVNDLTTSPMTPPVTQRMTQQRGKRRTSR